MTPIQFYKMMEDVEIYCYIVVWEREIIDNSEMHNNPITLH